MARRALHNEGSEILRERLNGKVDVDFDTARRLFTLVSVLALAGRRSQMAGDLPGAVLFACSQNAIRSPMAAGLMKHFYGHKVFVARCGVTPTEARSLPDRRHGRTSASTLRRTAPQQLR